jgi:AcrR family transcriptional regulator
MPNPTFYKLPEKKRLFIINIALKEFADYGYDNASLTRIVEQAGIAKGSIYQYFQDKQDLYIYLLELSLQEKEDFLRRRVSFFPYIRWIFGIHVDFEKEHPNLCKLLNQVIHGQPSIEHPGINRIRQSSLRYIWQLVRQGVAQGDIRTKNSRLTAYIIDSVMERLSSFIITQTDIDPEVTQDIALEDIDPRIVDKILDDLVILLEFGVSNYHQHKANSEPSQMDLPGDPQPGKQEITNSMLETGVMEDMKFPEMNMSVDNETT